MKEKELRIALVCFGGISLAIYMHGISKEIVKLVRASATLHGIGDRAARLRDTFPEHAPPVTGEYDTETVYFELLREIGRKVDLRVIVDVVAGASAGGINGTMLACALARDLPVTPLRDLWMEHADLAALLAPEARAKAWSKAVLKPLFWGVGASGLLPSISDREVRSNLSLFVRSRWFRPPLDGGRMAGLMLDAINVINARARRRASLLPPGHQLDLFVTLTDFHGHQHQVQIHDPPLIYEHEHRHLLHFHHRSTQTGTIESDFRPVDAPALAFAARATSSFPGMFPPAQIAEIDRLLAQRQVTWTARQQFLERAFARYMEVGIDPAHASFIDGSVLNNRPFREAIAAIHGRHAYRQVDRRLLYIDPFPALAPSSARKPIPGMFTVLKGSISDLPRNQPVADELDWVTGFNDRVGQLRGIIETARPRVTRLVTEIMAVSLDRAVTARELGSWRRQVNAQVARDAGFAYQGYVQLKLTTVLDFIHRLLAKMRGVDTRSALGRVMAATVEAWVARNGVVPVADNGVAEASATSREPSRLPLWAQFLDDFDANYRKRRLNFLIEGQNRLYQLMDAEHFAGLEPAIVDRLKRDLYIRLDALQRRQDGAAYHPELRALVTAIFPSTPSAEEMRDLHAFAQGLAEQHSSTLDRLMKRLAAEIDLNTCTRDTDLLLAALDPRDWHSDARREVLVNYLGFPYWDVLTLPVTTARRAGELHEILVDRISAADAHTLNGFNGFGSLKGMGFGNFAAFLSRAYRENDYLLGRLHGIDRLIDIVCDAAGFGADSGSIDIVALKKKAFAIVLDTETGHLRESGPLFEALRQAVHAL